MNLPRTQAARRNFLRGAVNDTGPIRPVGAAGEFAFRDDCTQCGACAKACPENIIKRDTSGFPVVDFSRGPCTFCGDCTASCDTGALSADQPWAYRASLSSECLAMNSVHCRSCQDFCDTSAIRFRLRPGGRAEPQIELSDCTGCGECLAACPVAAITLEQITPKMEVRQC